MRFPLFPEQASSIAKEVDALFVALIVTCGVVLLGLLVVMLYFLIKYRHGKALPAPFKHIPTLPFELTWIFIPLLLFMGMFAWGAIIYNDMQMVPPDALEINVIGKQWMWKLQHPGGQREINELHVPAGRVVKLTLASQDVIHSFFLPAFRIKQDVVPGRFTTLWFEATEVGVFHLFCAEYCGNDHSQMRGRIVVMKPEDYERWLTSGEPEPSLIHRGATLFRNLGCSGCHSPNSVVRAPPLEGLYQRPVPLASGEVIQADEAYLRDSILLPQRDIAAGYEPLMPSYEGQIDEEHLFELIAYLKSLGNGTPMDLR